MVTRWALVRRPSVSLPDSTALELDLRTRLDCSPPNSTLVLSSNSTRTQVVSSDATPSTPLTPDSNTQLWRSPHRLAKETKERETLSPARPHSLSAFQRGPLSPRGVRPSLLGARGKIPGEFSGFHTFSNRHFCLPVPEYRGGSWRVVLSSEYLVIGNVAFVCRGWSLCCGD